MLRYSVAFDRPHLHLFAVTIELETNGAEEIDLEFPSWSPGRYFIYDFSRNVQELRAAGDGNRSLKVEKIAKGTWRIGCARNRRITISYKMFGDTLSGTFSQLDDRHASINGSSLFGYIVGRQSEPIALEIDAPEQWKIYTAMRRRRERGRAIYHAENYDQLIDSPIEAGTPIARRFVHDEVTYHVIIDIAGAEGTRRSREVKEQVNRYVEDVEKVVRAYTATFGRPEFDEYYFLANIDPAAANGDGMEHQASTRLVINGYITNDDDYDALIGVTSHEFFHIWNVKRLRPAELGPFDYTRERHTTLLWFAEGFTQYYGHLMLRRAGVWDDKQFYKEMVDEFNAVDRSPGRHHRNLRDSSFDTWHAVNTRSPMGIISNFKNTYVNYYFKGAVVGLLLDLEIRRRTENRRSLDDLVRELYRSSYADAELDGYYLRGSGYSEADVLEAVRRVAGDEASAFLEKLIEGRDDIDYNPHLRYVGLELRRGKKGTPKRKDAKKRTERVDAKKKEGEEDESDDKPQLFTGLVLGDLRERAREDFVRVMNVLDGSPGDSAGLSAGDLIIALDGERTDGRRWDQVLEMKRPGDTMRVTFFRGPRLLETSLHSEERDTRPLRFEKLDDATPAEKRARAKWLSLSSH
jgi:predicted metalloprotease with PDZ domain